MNDGAIVHYNGNITGCFSTFSAVADPDLQKRAGRLLPPNNFTAIFNVSLTVYVSILNNKLSTSALTQILEHLFNHLTL